MALSKVDLANQVENQLPQSLVADNVNFRNIIINGDMSIAQRGTSASSLTGSSYETVDRFKQEISSQGTWTQSQSTDVPSGQGFATSLKMDCTTADASPAASDYIYITQKIEGQNLQYLKKGTSSAESTTLSFWVKSNKTGTYIARLRDADNTRSTSKSYTISSADTWEKKTITFDGDTTGALTNDNGTSLQLYFYLGAGSNYTSGTLATSWEANTNANNAVGQVNLADSTANEWYITGVQLEAGTAASDFEFLPYDINLRRCQRYYYKLSTSGQKFVGFAQVDNDDLNCPAIIDFKVDMRTAPTSVETPSAATSYRLREALTYNCTAVPSFNNATVFNSTLAFRRSGITSSDGFAQGELLKATLNSAILAWSAELWLL